MEAVDQPVDHAVGDRFRIFRRHLQRRQGLLALALLVSSITLGSGRTSLMQGAVHLVIFAVFLFLTLVP